MTRELPFDDETAAGDETGDAAYRVATGVARVARAGAYVTGGALIASNGSPAPENESHNSHFAGWSTVDPDPDVPSPVVTYPDPSPDSVPPDLGTYSAPQTPPAPGNVFADEYGTDVFPVPQFPFAEQAPSAPDFGGLPSAPQGGTDAPFSIPGPDAPQGRLDTFDIPGSGANQGFSIPGSHPADTADSSGGLGLPEWQGAADSRLGLPRHEAAEDRHHGVDLPGADTHPTAPLPGHGLGLPGTNGLNLPGMNGLGPGGLGWGDDPAGGHTPGWDGVGDGGNPGIFLGTEMKVDAHIGLDGIWVTTETKVDFAIGDVGHQLDDYGQWIGSGVNEIPGGTTQSADAGVSGALGGAVAPAQSAGAEAAAVGAAGPTLDPGAAQAGTAGAQGVATSQGVAGSSQNVAATQSAAVSGQHAAIAPAPAAPASFPAPQMTSVAAPQPITTAPVVAAPAPPPPAPAPVPVQPVASTPLQTTIQPEAATHPVANVITAHPGPSPLTAPAAAVPALFDYRPADPLPEVESPGSGADESSGTSTTTHAPTTTPHTGTSTSLGPDTGTSHSTTPTTGSGHSSVVAPTGTPGTSTSPGSSTGHETTEHGTPTTTRPGDSDSTGTGSTHTPSTSAGSDSGHSGSDSGQVTTPGTTGSDATTSVPGATHAPGTSSGADTSAPGTADGSVAPTQGSVPGSGADAGPTHQVPTQSMPTQQPSAPTAPHTVDPGAGMPSHTAPAAPTAVKPPTTIDPVPDAQLPVKPISSVSDAPDAGLFTDSGHGLTSLASTGLSAGLHDTGHAESHHLVVHPVADLHITL